MAYTDVVQLACIAIGLVRIFADYIRRSHSPIILDELFVFIASFLCPIDLASPDSVFGGLVLLDYFQIHILTLITKPKPTTPTKA